MVQLFRWVAWFTGSKNAMKGIGFFVGGLVVFGGGSLFERILLLREGFFGGGQRGSGGDGEKRKSHFRVSR